MNTTLLRAINTANRQLSSRHVEGESFTFQKCWEHIEIVLNDTGGCRWPGKVKYGVRGTEVRGLDGGGTMVWSTKTCSIDSSRRDTSIEHGFHDWHQSGTALNISWSRRGEHPLRPYPTFPWSAPPPLTCPASWDIQRRSWFVPTMKPCAIDVSRWELSSEHSLVIETIVEPS